MNATGTAVDLDDVEGLLAADREGLLRAASTAGAQVRATAAALDEGVLEPLRSSEPPRTVIWVAGRGTAEAAGQLLAETFGGSAAAPVVVSPQVPPWIGALDVVVIAGDDAGDPALVDAAATGVHRGARVVVAAPYEGPLRDATAGRAVALPPRVWLPDGFGFTRYFAVGLAVLSVVDPGLSVDVAALADELDAEALRNSAAREVFTNPAKNLASRMSDGRVLLVGDSAPAAVLAAHGCAVLLRVGLATVTAAGLQDALVALGGGLAGADAETSLFHDEQIDGPLPARVRTFVLTTDEERPLVLARVAGVDDVDVLSAEDVPDGQAPAPGTSREQQLAVLAVRLEMTAVYLRLVRG